MSSSSKLTVSFNRSAIVITLAAIAGCGTSAASPPAPAATAATALSKAAAKSETTTATGSADADDGIALPEASKEWVTASTVAPSRFAPTVEAPGRFELREGAVADVVAPVAGRVSEVHVVPGDVVKAGDALVTIESPEAVAARAELSQAQAEMRAALDAARRYQKMMAAGVGIELEGALAETRLAESRTAVDRAERSVALLGEGAGPTVVVRASRDGTVLDRKVDQGAAVGPESGALLHVGDPTKVWLVAQVFERDLAELAAGSAARVSTTSGQTLAGRVARIGSVVDASTRRAPVYIELVDQKSVTPRAGTWARVDLDGHARDGLVLPVEAVLVKSQGTHVVYVEDHGRYHAREVAVGVRSTKGIEIVSGLAPADRIVLRGALLLDGQASLLL